MPGGKTVQSPAAVMHGFSPDAETDMEES